MKVLIIGGTGLISLGIVKHLLARGAEVTAFNRARRSNPFADSVRTIIGDRDNFPSFESLFANQQFDVVIDMICFSPRQAESDVRAFAGRCRQFIFCSTVCTYGAKIAEKVLVDEAFPQEPISGYGENKLACEKIFLAAHEKRQFDATIIRPSHTYGPDHPLIDNLESNPVSWDRVTKDQPILCAGDGLGLWQSTHRDDVGRLFAHACLNQKTFGQSYNATRTTITPWLEYYRQVAGALGRRAKVVFMPADWIVAHEPKRFSLLGEITRYHGAYSSAKATRDVPEFSPPFVDLPEGASEIFNSLRKNNRWKSADGDSVYEQMISQAAAAGIKPIVI